MAFQTVNPGLIQAETQKGNSGPFSGFGRLLAKYYSGGLLGKGNQSTGTSALSNSLNSGSSLAGDGNSSGWSGLLGYGS